MSHNINPNQHSLDYRAILDQNLACVYVVQDGFMVYVNQAYADLLGYDHPDDIINKIPVFDLVCPQSKNKAKSNLDKQLSGQISKAHDQLNLIKKDGSLVTVAAHESISEYNGRPAITGILIDQTLLKNTEDALNASKEMLELFIKHSPAAVAMFDQEMRYLAASAGWFQDYGLQDTDIIGRCHYDIFPETPASWRTAHKKGLSGKVLKEDNAPLPRQDGTIQYIRWEISPWRHINGDVGGIVIYTSDVTTYHKLETSLSISEKRFENIFQNAPLGMALVDETGHPVLSNKALSDMLGYSASELAKKSFVEFTHPDDIDKDLAQYQDLLARRIDRYSMEKRYLSKDGKTIWGNLTVSAIFNPDGSVMNGIGMVDDITAQHKNEESLRRSIEVFNNTTEGILITNRDNKIVDVNPAFSRITGYSKEEVLGKNPSILNSGRNKPSLYVQMWNSLNKLGNWSGEIWNRRKDGKTYPEWLNISAIKSKKGVINSYVAVFSDITDLKESQAKIEHLALHDPLTALPNRLHLFARMEHAIEMAKRSRSMIAVCFLDIDNFKNINDTFGHNVGDSIILKVAQRLKKTLRKDDTVARLGGDEFVVLLENAISPDNIATGLNKILSEVAKPFILNGIQHHCTVSIGVALFPEDHEDPKELIRFADAAMYRSKEEGKNTFTFYKDEITQSMFEKLLIENNLRRGIEQDEFELFYQPQVNFETGLITGFEALVRWDHPDMGLVYPDKFIPIAESTRLIVPLGNMIFKKACYQLQEWKKNYAFEGSIAINVSGVQLNQQDFIQNVTEILTETGISGQSIEIEITESVLMKDPLHWIEVLNQLKSLGFTIAIDDFGTGYSSLGYLYRFPIDKLKIDKSFVKGLPHKSGAGKIVTTIIALAQSLGMQTIAEGIETEEQANYLKNLSCDEAQGYLYSRPQPAEAIQQLLKR